MATVNDHFPGKYFKGATLVGEDEIILTIESVEVESIQNPSTGQSEDKPVVYFREDDRGLIVSSGAKFSTIAEVLGGLEDDEDWPGNQLRIFPSTAKFQGKNVPSVGIGAV